MKNERWYKRIIRRGIKSVKLEVILVSIGKNLYKSHNKQKNQRLYNSEKSGFMGERELCSFLQEKTEFLHIRKRAHE